MQAVLDFINKHHYDIFIPLTALAVLRIIVCRAQLKKIAALREKKGAYHAVGGNYTAAFFWARPGKKRAPSWTISTGRWRWS